jgi:hypothetical protein
MTCIVGVAHQGVVYLGGDSAGIAGRNLDIRADPKVFRVGEFVMGFTDSFRMGQLLQHAFVPPPLVEGQELHRYMVTAFVDALRTMFKDKGFARDDNGTESAGTFLVGVRGRLFAVCSDYQVGENAFGFDAVGCGEAPAKGALFATSRLSPYARLTRALKAAEQFNTGVRGPFRFVQTEVSK